MISIYFKYEVWQLSNILHCIGICKEWKSLKGIWNPDHFPVYWQFKNKISICFIKDETEQGITLEATWLFFFFFFRAWRPFPPTLSLPIQPIPRYFETCYFAKFSLNKGISRGYLIAIFFLISTFFVCLFEFWRSPLYWKGNNFNYVGFCFFCGDQSCFKPHFFFVVPKSYH